MVIVELNEELPKNKIESGEINIACLAPLDMPLPETVEVKGWGADNLTLTLGDYPASPNTFKHYTYFPENILENPCCRLINDPKTVLDNNGSQRSIAFEDSPTPITRIAETLIDSTWFGAPAYSETQLGQTKIHYVHGMSFYRYFNESDDGPITVGKYLGLRFYVNDLCLRINLCLEGSNAAEPKFTHMKAHQLNERNRIFE
ncbi:hypothetical protein Ddc_14407 [Ditylenchus destructor]|nr:hypothetical protein Ddc_14407 [Ditylenchus destructor]